MSKGLNKLHPKQLYYFATNIINLFGKGFFFLIVTSYVANVGAVHDMIPIVQFPYYLLAGVTAQVQSEMAAIAKSPFSCKGFVGVLSDILPIFGRSKFYYLIIYSFLGIACCFGLALLPLDIVGQQPIIPAILFFGLNLYSAAFDLLLEAKYIELMQKTPGIKADLLTFAWFNQIMGQFIPALTIGVISDMAATKTTDIRVIFWIFLPLCLCPIPPILLGGCIHDNVPKHKSNRIDIEKIKSQWQLILLTFLQAIFAFGTVLLTFLTDSTGQLIYIIAVSFFLSILAFVLLDKITASFNLYTYLSQSLYANIQGALEYYYRAKEDCVIDGPKFGFFEISTLSPLLQNIGQLIAVFIFQLYLQKTKFRFLFWSTTVLRMIGSISDIALVNKWNRAIGIPDVVIFLTGYATLEKIAYMLDFLPTVFMMSKLCPKSLESTMYAFLAGLFHFGGTTSYYLGVFLMDAFHIQSIPVPEENIECDYSNLTIITVIAHMIMPAITIPLVYVLIPGIRLNENVRHDYDNLEVNQKKSIEFKNEIENTSTIY